MRKAAVVVVITLSRPCHGRPLEEAFGWLTSHTLRTQRGDRVSLKAIGQ